MDLINVAKTINFCKEKYDDKTFAHALRVGELAVGNPLMKTLDWNKLYVFAILHDIIEDTDTTFADLEEVTCISEYDLHVTLDLLTKKEHEDYLDYICRLRTSGDLYAYAVKLADMKDHLMQKETLTDRLKEKYWNALPELL